MECCAHSTTRWLFHYTLYNAADSKKIEIVNKRPLQRIGTAAIQKIESRIDDETRDGTPICRSLLPRRIDKYEFNSQKNKMSTMR